MEILFEWVREGSMMMEALAAGVWRFELPIWEKEYGP